MKINTVAQLLEPARISSGLLGDALRRGAPEAFAACLAPGSPLRPDPLQAALITALPSALQVGLRECICHRWWPSQALSNKPPQAIDWMLQPTLEWLFEGWPRIGVLLVATVRLQQQPQTHLWLDRNEGTLTVGEDRVWSAWLGLAVGDTNRTTPPVVFHEARADVYLDRGPWKV